MNPHGLYFRFFILLLIAVTLAFAGLLPGLALLALAALAWPAAQVTRLRPIDYLGWA